MQRWRRADAFRATPANPGSSARLTNQMMATRSLGSNLGIPAGAWRWAALGFVFLALAAAGLAVMTPNAVGWAGVMLVGGDRRGGKPVPVRGVAQGKAEQQRRATGGGGGGARQCRLGDHRHGRRGAGLQRRLSPHVGRNRRRSRAAAGTGAGGRAVCRRALSPVARRRRRRGARGNVPVGPGLEIVAAVRPLSDGQTAWWFTPRLSAMRSPNGLCARAALAPAAPQRHRRPLPRCADGRGVCRRRRQDRRRQCGFREILRRRRRADRPDVRRPGRRRRSQPASAS